MCTIMAVLKAAYYVVRIYSRVPYPLLYPAPDDLSGDGPGRLFRLPPSFLVFIRRFEIDETVPGSCFPAGSVEAVFHRMERIGWDETLHPGYCRYS